MSHAYNVSASVDFDRKFSIIAFGLLIAVIIFSTYLHHFQPHILNVPSNTNVASWKMTPIEHTWIYDRMNAAELEKVKTQGIPGTDFFTMLVYLGLSLFGTYLCFSHAKKHYSYRMAALFLIGSFIFTGLQETLMILSGRFWMGGGQIDPNVWGSYWFPQGLLWFFETPVWVCLCWFIIAYSCVWVAKQVFPALPLWSRALIGGLTAMVIDLWEDPVLTSPEHMKWIWAKGDHIGILGIPHGNFLGWFFLIFWFVILWEKYLPLCEKRRGAGKGTLAFVGLILISNIIVLAILIIEGHIMIRVFPQGLHIPPLSWDW
ncbi:MAG: carotenoid biosynthesis protein [Deltaproteobacteria bacterium]|nr:carotenoid biosynthesis protein [Deltaproteobacteria bacterium]